ncbi:MAG: hypothetical protein C7B44_08125 [Sulfobacillus thermosulfidooxidans]|uniref:TMEM205-like domain-containing protein n=1 Tax=Sulfobacillus thermotolerans TaxID=338644 RepID=A0ABN5GYU0_9FIRM|nr:DUF4149 domain-containing protein [Sulfobacillus sp. hq2]AUW93314.1 hypothetical protein BXT84_04550 [Sulfobacillus thermotolerans]MCY0907346.1 DUF4149 domain-containing protein [Sulfobacillus thermotolerans]POB11604.1 hypothetical protein CO251_03245 [Sulfobacillus sp. hq2]PSR36602.1 MAG: hypothetical protein C7B44_08125 [Sulfobacillus thermosulfidooxidans]
MTRNIGRLLWMMGTGIWLGTILFFSLVVAEAVFKVLPMEDAGKLLVQIFPAYYGIGLWAGGAALVGALIVAWFSSRRMGWVLFAQAFISWILVLYANSMLHVMNEIRSTSSEFAQLHGESVMINTVIGILLIVGFIIEVWFVGEST